jgi:predicted nicotinamide N-methyase
MRYPLKLIPVSANLSIYVPDYKQVKATYEKLRQVNPAELFPYWAKLWPSSIAMVQFIQANTGLIKDKAVLEIGAGLGLPSFAIAGIVKSIEVTDYAAEAVELLEKNIQHLQLSNIRAKQLDWNQFSGTIDAAVLLLSDVNYNPDEFDGLMQLINQCIDSGSTVLLATPQRIMASPFVNALHQLVRQRHIELVNENGKSIEISILVLSK